MRTRTIRFVGSAALCTVALAVACSKSPASPSAPAASLTPGTNANANADGSTLKALAPTPISPANNQRFANADAIDSNVSVTLTITNSATPFTAGAPLTYRFELYNGAGTRVFQSGALTAGAATTSVTVPLNLEGLEGDQAYSWQARAELQGQAGPWSNRAAFVEVPPVVAGYVRSNEIYDPLTKGKTVGTIHGDVTFIPNVGMQINDHDSYIEYTVPQTLNSGEFSALFTNLKVKSRNEDPKDRVLTMREGDAAINDNRYRASIDVRGNGAIAWRFISGDAGTGNYLETVGAERVPYSFNASETYFIRASWGNGNIWGVLFQEGGFNGATIYNSQREYDGTYRPSPHRAYLGSPYQAGDRGEPASYPGMIVKQVWLSANPRPSHINK